MQKASAWKWGKKKSGRKIKSSAVNFLCRNHIWDKKKMIGFSEETVAHGKQRSEKSESTA